MTATRNQVGTRTERVAAATERATAALFASRRPDGSWPGRLSPAATATGAAVAALHRCDPTGSADVIRRGVGWLLRTQAADGGWGEDVGEPATRNATALALAGLTLACTDEADAIARGWAAIERLGGDAALRDKDRTSLGRIALGLLALESHYDETSLTRVPLELALLPRRLRTKLSFTVPGVLAWGVMDAARRPPRSPLRLLYPLARRRAFAYLDALVAFEGDDGGFEESPLMSSCVAVGLHEAGQRPDIVEHCLRYLRSTQRADGSWSVNRDLEIPVCGYVVNGLVDAGYGADERLAATADWFVRRQRGGMPAITGTPAGGWGWAWPSGWPNTGDTTAAMLALHRFGRGGDRDVLAAGTRWLLDMQNKDGSWSCFCRDATLSLDAPCTVMTADAVSTLLHVSALPPEHPALRRVAAWLRSAQRPDGSFEARWYVGATAGTAGALRALTELGLGDAATARAARAWLRTHRNPDGGWGVDPGEPSVVELTAWVALALLAPDDPLDPELLDDAVDFLLGRQGADGLWSPSVYGIYFMDVLYASDHHANGHALQVLARWQHRFADAA